MIKRSRLALPAIAVAIALAGCGGSDDSTDLTSDLTADQLLDRSAAAATELETFTLGVEGDITPTLSSDPGAAPALPVNGPVGIEARGPVVQPDRLSLDATVTLGALPLQVNFTRVSGEVFVTALGRDYRLGLPESQVEQVDASVVFPTIVRWIADPEIDGRDTVDGQESVRITGTLDAEEAAADLVTVTAALGLGAAGSPAAIAEQISAQIDDDDRVTVWVRANDLAPARMDVSFGIEDATALSEALTALEADLSLTLTDFDAGLAVEAPSDPQLLTLDDLTQLAGGLG